MIESEKYCKLCRKLLYQEIGYCFKLCPDCYLISTRCIESTLTKNLFKLFIYHVGIMTLIVELVN